MLLHRCWFVYMSRHIDNKNTKQITPATIVSTCIQAYNARQWSLNSVRVLTDNILADYDNFKTKFGQIV
jgi:hypothetical protein